MMVRMRTRTAAAETGHGANHAGTAGTGHGANHAGAAGTGHEANHEGAAGTWHEANHEGANGPGRGALGRLALGALTALVLLVPAAPAGADVGASIIERCTHGQSLRGFSQQAYRQALAEMPAEVNEYSECAAQIRKAELVGAGGGAAARGGGGPSGATANVAPPSPAEQQTLQSAHGAAGATPVNVGGQAVVPGVVHADVASAVSALPMPLLAVLALLLIGGGVLLARALQGLVGARRDS